MLKAVPSQLQALVPVTKFDSGSVEAFCCVLLYPVGLTQLLSCPGVHYVFDTTFSRNFSLLESQREFVRRFQKQAEDKKALPMLASACPGMG